MSVNDSSTAFNLKTKCKLEFQAHGKGVIDYNQTPLKDALLMILYV